MGDERDPNYKNPGAAKARLTLFWCTNYKIDTSKKVLDQAEKLLGEHNIGLDVYPGRTRTDKHTITVPADHLILPEEYNDLRLKAAAIFDDQKTPDKRQRLPVFFCEFKDVGHGITVITKKPGDPSGSTWLPYCLVSGVIDNDNATLVHELGHAAHNSGVHSPDLGHVMHNAPAAKARTIIDKIWVQIYARGYYVK